MSELRWIVVFVLLFVTLVYAASYHYTVQAFEDWKESRIQLYIENYPNTSWNDTLHFMFHESPVGITYIVVGLAIASAWIVLFGMSARAQNIMLFRKRK